MSKGRTLFEILTGWNQKKVVLELQYHNPLSAKIGNTVSLDCDPDIKDINFVIEKISVYETIYENKKFEHTDYHLKGLALGMEAPIRFRLRLVRDGDNTNELGCQILLMQVFDEVAFSDEHYQDAYQAVQQNEFHINYDEAGQPLNPASRYWRIRDLVDPYHAKVTILKDTDGDGTVEEDELDRLNATYWEFSRNTEDANQQAFTEYLTIEMNDKTKLLTFLKGTQVNASQITVI